MIYKWKIVGSIVALVLVVFVCVIGCSSETIVGSIESYNHLVLKGFPIQLTLLIDNGEHQTFKNYVARVDRYGKFIFRIGDALAEIRDIDIQPATNWRIWQNSEDPTSILKNPIIVVDPEWKKSKSSKALDLRQATMFNAIQIGELAVDSISNIANLTFSWADDIPNVDFYSARISKIDDQSLGLSVMGLRSGQFDGLVIEALPELDTDLDITTMIKSGPVVTMKPLFLPGHYVITIRAYRFINDNTSYIMVGHSRFELPGRTFRWIDTSLHKY